MRLGHTAPLGDEESDRLRDPTDGLDVDALIVSVEGFGDGSVLASDRDHEPTWSIAPAQALLGLDGVFLHRDRQWEYWMFSMFLDTDCHGQCCADGGP